MAGNSTDRSVTEQEKPSDTSKPDPKTIEAETVATAEQKQKRKPSKPEAELDDNAGAELYLQSRIDEMIGASRGTVGRPPVLRLFPVRTFPEWARLDCRSIDVIDGEPIDLEDIARENGGGRYAVRLKRGRSFVPHARVTVSFAGPPITLPGEGPDPWAAERSGPIRHPQGAPEPRSVPGDAAQEVGQAIAQFGDQFKATLEGMAGLVQTTQIQYAEIQAEFKRLRENPPDAAAEVQRSVSLVTGLLDVANTLRPPAPEPAAAPDASAFAAVFNQVVSAAPQIMAAWQSVSSGGNGQAQPQLPATSQPPAQAQAPDPDPSTPAAAAPRVSQESTGTASRPAKKTPRRKKAPAKGGSRRKR